MFCGIYSIPCSELEAGFRVRNGPCLQTTLGLQLEEEVETVMSS
jgi:hypothetical protein